MTNFHVIEDLDIYVVPHYMCLYFFLFLLVSCLLSLRFIAISLSQQTEYQINVDQI